MRLILLRQRLVDINGVPQAFGILMYRPQRRHRNFPYQAFALARLADDHHAHVVIHRPRPVPVRAGCTDLEFNGND